jgi:hypothetical protein
VASNLERLLRPHERIGRSAPGQRDHRQTDGVRGALLHVVSLDGLREAAVRCPGSVEPAPVDVDDRDLPEKHGHCDSRLTHRLVAQGAGHVEHLVPLAEDEQRIRLGENDHSQLRFPTRRASASPLSTNSRPSCAVLA